LQDNLHILIEKASRLGLKVYHLESADLVVENRTALKVPTAAGTTERGSAVLRTSFPLKNSGRSF